MVTQPAYLKALKAYTRSMYGDDKLQSSLDDLSNESDRGAVILAATAVEDMLEMSIGVRMPNLATDVAARSDVFGVNAPISTFSNKIVVAYAMGIIDKQARREIDLIRDIRNSCAHSRLPISFHVKELQDAAKIVIGDAFLAEIKDHSPKTLRQAFIIRCALIAKYVGTGKRQSPAEAYEEEQAKKEQRA